LSISFDFDKSEVRFSSQGLARIARLCIASARVRADGARGGSGDGGCGSGGTSVGRGGG